MNESTQRCPCVFLVWPVLALVARRLWYKHCRRSHPTLRLGQPRTTPAMTSLRLRRGTLPREVRYARTKQDFSMLAWMIYRKVKLRPVQRLLFQLFQFFSQNSLCRKKVILKRFSLQTVSVVKVIFSVLKAVPQHCTSETRVILSISVSDSSDRHLEIPSYKSTSVSCNTSGVSCKPSTRWPEYSTRAVVTLHQ